MKELGRKILFFSVFLAGCTPSLEYSFSIDLSNGVTPNPIPSSPANLRVFSQVWKPSKFEHTGTELSASQSPVIIPGTSPLKFTQIYESERDRFGWNPRFMPGEVSFDASNRPYIRTGGLYIDEHNKERYGLKSNFIQTLGPGKKWIAVKLEDILSSKIPNFSATIAQSEWVGDTRVLVDDEGSIYTIANRYLLRNNSSDQWNVINISGLSGRIKLESSSDKDTKRLPVVHSLHGQVKSLQMMPDLTLQESQLIADSVDMSPGHSGAGKATIRIGNKTWFSYAGQSLIERTDPDVQAIPDLNTLNTYLNYAYETAGQGLSTMPGSPQFVSFFDHTTGTRGNPILIGFGRNTFTPDVDSHNGPVMEKDNDGFLHVITGAHQHQFFHVYSKVKDPVQRSDWTKNFPIVERRGPATGVTYASLVCDGNNTLHLVTRNMSQDLDNSGSRLPSLQMNTNNMTRHLDYYRGRKNQNGSWTWEDLGALILPIWNKGYSVFYHRLTLDRRDRLFLSYSLMIEITSVLDPTGSYESGYLLKWPEYVRAGSGGSTEWQAHNAGMIMSSDHGNTWRIVTTDDFDGE